MTESNKVTIQDITLDEQGRERFSQAELKRMLDMDISFSDTETTGLNRKRHILTEFASIKAVKEDDGYHLKLFNAFMLPFKPVYQEYLEAKQSGQPIPYDRKRYEYDIDLNALAVTGTKLIRENPAGPIVAMEVGGKRVNAYPFYELADEIAGFIAPDDLYFNAPFDKPFLAEKWRDVVAWRQLRDNGHMAMPPELMDGLEERPYSNMDQEERDEVLERIHSQIDTLPGLTNSAEYRCLLHMYLLANGHGPSNRLDDAYRQMVDPDYTERGDHSAVEDIIMEAKVGMALLDKLQGLPNIAEIYQALLRRADPGCVVEVAEPRPYLKATDKDGMVEGDIRITFSKPISQLPARAREYWQLFREFDEVTQRNSRVPQHIVSMDQKKHTVTLNAERSQPLTLNMLRKLMFYQEMLDSGKFDNIHLFDSTGNRIDVTLTGKKPLAERTLEDIHFGSLRKNLKYLVQHEGQLSGNLNFIRSVREHSRKVGLCLYRSGEDGQGDTVTIRGHLRAFGDVTFQLPPGKSPSECQQEIMENFDFLLNIGAIPGVESSQTQTDNPDARQESDEQEDTPDETKGTGAEAIFSHTVIDMAEPDSIKVVVSPMIMEVVARRRGITIDAGKPVALGNVIASRDDDGNYVLSGKKIDFRDVMNTGRVLVQNAQLGMSGGEPYIQKAAVIADQKDDDGRVHPVSSLVRDASWLLYRLGKVPGTHRIEQKDGKVTLFQEDGLSIDALELLTRCNIPFSATDKTITVDTDFMMHDAFHWSQEMGRQLEELYANQERPVSKRTPLPEYIKALHRTLLEGKVSQVDVDELGECWITDGKAGPLTLPRRYKLDKEEKHFSIHKNAEGGLAISRSTVAGFHKYMAHESGATLNVRMSATMAEAVYENLRSEHGYQNAELRQDADGLMLLAVPADGIDKLKKSVQDCSDLLYALSKVSGGDRISARTVEIAPGGKIAIQPAHVEMLEDKHYLKDLIHLYNDITAQHVKQSIKAVPDLFPSVASFDRRRTDVSELTSMLASSHIQLDEISHSMLRLAGNIQNCGYSRRVHKDVSAASTVIHELQSYLDTKAALLDGSKPYDRAMIGRIHMVREKLANAGYALNRLEEAAFVVNKSISGERNDNLFKVLADGYLFHLDSYMEDARHQPSITAAVEEYEQTVKEALHKAHPRWSQREIDRKLALAYQHKAMEYMLKLDESPKNAGLVERMLERSDPNLSEEQIRSLIALYTFKGKRDSKWREKSIDELGQWFADSTPASIEQIVDTCITLKDPKRQARIEKRWRQDINEQVEQLILDAYERRARHYLYLINESPGYEDKARELLEKTGADEGYIERRIQTAKRHSYAESTRDKARQALKPREIEGYAQDYLDYIDMNPAYEKAARKKLREDMNAEIHDRMESIGKARPDPYAELKLRRRLIHAIQSLSDEMHDLSMVHYHCIRNMNDAIALLAADQRQMADISHTSDAARTVGHSLHPSADLFGTDRGLVDVAYHSRDRLSEACGRQLRQKLKYLEVPGIEEKDDEVYFDGAAMLKAPAHWTKLLMAEHQIVQEVQASKPPEKPPAIKPPARPSSDLEAILGGLAGAASLSEQMHGIDPSFSMDISMTLHADAFAGPAAFAQLRDYLISLQQRQKDDMSYQAGIVELQAGDSNISLRVNAQYMDHLSKGLRMAEKLANSGVTEAIAAGAAIPEIDVRLVPVDFQSRADMHKKLEAATEKCGYGLPPHDIVYPRSSFKKPVQITLKPKRELRADIAPIMGPHRPPDIENVSSESREVYEAMRREGPEEMSFAERRLHEKFGQGSEPRRRA